MLIRKPSIFAATLSSLHPLQPSACASSTSSSSSRWQQKSTRPQEQCQKTTRKGYATIASEPGNTHEENGNHENHWPKASKGQTCPTPYQIFSLKQHETYSKARFYELVKLYHPDRNSTKDDATPHHIKIERYRLIVAAHTILSDPSKRSAYDRFGAGWDGKAEVGKPENWQQTSPYHPPGPFSQSWGHHGDPIWQNATWEDWERFHAKRAEDASGQSQQQPVYLKNTYFLALIVFLAFAGSSANYSRAQDAGTYFVEQRDIVHDRAAKELRKVKQDVQGRGREERIQWFIRQREAHLGLAGSDVETLREEKADKVLPNRDICRSEDISEKDV